MPPRPSLPRGAARPLVRFLQTTAPLPPPTAPLPPSDAPIGSTSTSTSVASSSASASASAASSSSSTLQPLPTHIRALRPLPPADLPTSTPAALQLLRDSTTPSSGIYCLARLHSRTYLLHPRDVLTLPTLKPLQPPGTTLQLSRILEVGSRDYAIRSPAAEARRVFKETGQDFDAVNELPSIPPWVARCELTVLEHTKSPLQKTFKKKRRKGYQKTIENKQGWTRLRVGDIVLGEGTPQPGEGEAGGVERELERLVIKEAAAEATEGRQ